MFVRLCSSINNKIISLKKFISPQPVGGPSKTKKNLGALGTCPVCPLVKTVRLSLLITDCLIVQRDDQFRTQFQLRAMPPGLERTTRETCMQERSRRMTRWNADTERSCVEFNRCIRLRAQLVSTSTPIATSRIDSQADHLAVRTNYSRVVCGMPSGAACLLPICPSRLVTSHFL